MPEAIHILTALGALTLSCAVVAGLSWLWRRKQRAIIPDDSEEVSVAAIIAEQEDEEADRRLEALGATEEERRGVLAIEDRAERARALRRVLRGRR